MIYEELFPEDAHVETFVHAAPDSLDVGKSTRGYWIAGNGLIKAPRLCLIPRPRPPRLGLRPRRECSRILDLSEHAAPS